MAKWDLQAFAGLRFPAGIDSPCGKVMSARFYAIAGHARIGVTVAELTHARRSMGKIEIYYLIVLPTLAFLLQAWKFIRDANADPKSRGGDGDQKGG